MCRESGCDYVRAVGLDRYGRRHHRLGRDETPMTALNPSPAAPPSQARSQLATGAYPGARRLSIQIAEGMPNPLGNGAARLSLLPETRRNPFCSLKRQTLNQTGSQCSERNKAIPVRVGNDADLRAGRAHLSWKRPVLRFFRRRLVGLARVGRHPSFLSPVVAVTAGVSQPQRVRSGDSIVGISHRALGKTSREIGGHEHVCVR